MFVEVVFCAQRVAEVWTAKLARALPLHRRNKHAVIVYKRQRTVGTHEDVVGLQVSVGERLRQQPHRHAAEIVCQHLDGIAVVDVLPDVFAESDAVYPVHQQHRKLAVIAALGVDEKLLVIIIHFGEIC